MLPYCDSLTVKLINLVDSVIADETQSVRESFSENLIAVISANQRKKDPQLLNLVLSTDGYSKTVVVRAIVTEHSSQKSSATFFRLLRDRALRPMRKKW